MKDKKIIKGEFAPRVNLGISVGLDYPFENDEMMLLRLETTVNGKVQPDYRVIMKEQDNGGQ